MTDPLEDPKSALTAERRRAERAAASGPVSLRVPAQVLEGSLRDVSESGSFLVLAGGPEFELEYEHEGVTETRTVRLIRAQQLPGCRVGWAVEFVD